MSFKSAVESAIRRHVFSRFKKVSEFEREKFIDEISRLVADEAGLRAFDEPARHYLLYRIGRKLLPKFVIADHGRVILDDQAFRDVFERFSGDNWTSFERKWNLKELLKQTLDLPGDYAECGVFRGGSAYFMCAQAQPLNKRVHLFDSFEGLSAPEAHEDFHWTEGDLAVGEAQVRANLSEFDNFATYPGWIPERFGDVASLSFSFVHVDVDLEQPTRDSIAFFYPRLVQGGILLLDDHGSAMCPGARSAALEYFEGTVEQVLDLATGQGLMIKRAPQ